MFCVIIYYIPINIFGGVVVVIVW